MQSMVFSSILDTEFRKKVAHKMMVMLDNNGFILWYDFIYNNPGNKDVAGIKKKEIKSLFPNTTMEFHRVTLAPPVARRIGNFYNCINNAFPFLRSHIITVIWKKYV